MLDIFLDRYDAGRRLAARLSEYKNRGTRVFAIPRGGVPVGYEVALGLDTRLELIIPRKLPIPWNPSAGFGAVTADGSIVLNEGMIRELGLDSRQTEAVASQVRIEIEQQAQTYGVSTDPPDLTGRVAVIVDDNQASGYTMLAAVASLRQAGAAELVAAVPVTSAHAARLVEPAVERLVVMIISNQLPFAASNFYVNSRDVSDDEVRELLRRRQSGQHQTSIT